MVVLRTYLVGPLFDLISAVTQNCGSLGDLLLPIELNPI
jgi:hypothetical protein